MSILNFSAITFSFSVAVILSSCGSRTTDLLPSGLTLYELEIPFAQRADKQNLSLVSTTHCSLREGGLVHTSGGHYSGYTAGEGILNNDTVIQTLSYLNTTSDLFEIEDG